MTMRARHPTATQERPVPARAAARLDRMPVSRWLTKVMVVLFLGWLVASYDIGLTGRLLPSLTHLEPLGPGLETVVSVSSSSAGVLGIVPAAWLSAPVGRKRVMIAQRVG